MTASGVSDRTNLPDAAASDRAFMQIGEVAERTGLTPRTLRYYEEKGLLNPPSRMDGGFRLYSDEDLQRLDRIKQLRDLLGFSLAEIKEMIEAEETRRDVRLNFKNYETDDERIVGLTRSIEATTYQLRLVTQKIEQLQQMQHALEERLARFQAARDRFSSGHSQ